MNVGMRVGVEQTYSPDHLWSARLMAHLCRERENQLVADNAMGPDYQVRAFAVAAIVASVAMLEARVNELWKDAALTVADGNRRHRLDGLDDDAIPLLATLHNTESLERSLKTLEKFDVTLRCAKKPEIEKGRYPHQAVEPLIRLRNELVHFKLELQWEDEVHHLEKKLSHLLPSNPLIAADEHPWFPLHPLCAGVAEWAWKACKAYVDDWQTQLGLTETYLEPFPVPYPDENA